MSLPTMKNRTSRTDLIFKSLEKGSTDLSEEAEANRLKFDNLNLESLRPKGSNVEYSSVKLKTELYDRIKHVAHSQGIKQPGKFISRILEVYLDQIEGK